ncbi:MAG: ATP-binding cassette domain-containing protein, partial [Caldilineales bacterium]|nr:ATP-binding cassette domain-containing protein [Caldilineales bacterium]
MSIVLEHLTKRYGGHPVVNDLSLEVADGEFFVLLGSSGSGKTTVLNMVAGLTSVDQGRVLLHGRDVTHLPPQERRVGFVFQHYALFQHMTVAENIEFGMRLRKMPAAERRRWRDELLELVGLVGLGKRMPRQLSGGQQQRVALARALAIRPDVLLLDEPLGALDAKIRVELRRALRRIQRELGVTTILVTHDQEEAFEVADRIGVMSFGRLLEVGPPQQLYRHPQTEFVAGFLGTANLLLGQKLDGAVQLGPICLPLPAHDPAPTDKRVQVLFRPEDVALAADPAELAAPLLGQGVVEQVVFSGAFERLRLRLPPLPGVRPIAPPVAFGDDTILVEATRQQDQADALPLREGDRVWVGVRHVHALEHPGLRFLLLTDGSARSQAALAVGGHLARLAHARTVVLGYGLKDAQAMQRHLQQAKETLGSGLAALEVRATAEPAAQAVRRESERQPLDLVVMGFDRSGGLDLAESILQAGDHNLLLVPRAQEVPTRALIAAATGEPGKDDVLFAGRLLRHVGAQATLISVLEDEADGAAHERAERFLAGGLRSLEVLGVPAQAAVRTGPVSKTIAQELVTNGYDLLVLGTPLADREGRISLRGVVEQVISETATCAILLVRAREYLYRWPAV